MVIAFALHFQTGIDPTTGQPIYEMFGVLAPHEHNGVSIQVVPSPGALLTLAALGGVRRRRR